MPMDGGAIVFVLYDEQELRVEEEVPVVFIDDTPTSDSDGKTIPYQPFGIWMVSNFLVERDNQVYLVPPGKLHD